MKTCRESIPWIRSSWNSRLFSLNQSRLDFLEKSRTSSEEVDLIWYHSDSIYGFFWTVRILRLRLKSRLKDIHVSFALETRDTEFPTESASFLLLQLEVEGLCGMGIAVVWWASLEFRWRTWDVVYEVTAFRTWVHQYRCVDVFLLEECICDAEFRLFPVAANLLWWGMRGLSLGLHDALGRVRCACITDPPLHDPHLVRYF